MRWIIALAGGVFAVAAYLFVWANLAPVPGEPLRPRVDAALDRALDYLAEADHFDQPRQRSRSGATPIEIWLAREIPAIHPHPGFAADVEAGWARVLGDERHRIYWALPGGRVNPVAERDREQLAQALTGEGTMRLGPWDRWYAYAVHPELLERAPRHRDGFLGGELWTWTGYDLTHRLASYWIMSRASPAAAAELDLDTRIRRAEDAIWLESHFDVFLSDLAIERVAFLAASQRDGLVRPRWIGRLLEDQNPEGGWAFSRAPACFLRRALFLECPRGPSANHPTFLAAYALAHWVRQDEGLDLHRGERVSSGERGEGARNRP